MLVYSIIMFITAAILLLVGILVYRGRTDLIHSYRQEKIADKKAYGKAMGKALAIIALPFTAAGILAFFNDGALLTIVFFVGLLLSLIPLFIVRKKYNGEMF